MTFWAAKNLNADWKDLVHETPLSLLLLWAREDQYSHDDKVMTLGDKEMIDELTKKRKN